MKKIIFLFAIVSTLPACFPNYSTGTRVGVVTKLSKRGVIWPSWEGELIMAMPEGMSAVNAEKFVFSADDSAVPSLQTAMKDGARVELDYTQWLVKPPTQETEYTVRTVAPTN